MDWDKVWYDEGMNQATLLRRLTGKQRLEQAFSLSDLVREFSLKNIRENEKLTKNEVMRELEKRMYGPTRFTSYDR